MVWNTHFPSPISVHDANSLVGFTSFSQSDNADLCECFTSFSQSDNADLCEH
jgi:hypothetical protein